MECAHCGDPVRKAKTWEKLADPIAGLLSLIKSEMFVHESKPENGIASTFPLTDMPEDRNDICSFYIFAYNPGIVQKDTKGENQQ